MQKIERVLLAQRTTDGKFLSLNKETNTTSYDFVDDPCLAERVTLYGEEEHIKNPREASYYFENSWRAKELWVKDCVMVAYEITTTVEAHKIESS